MRSIKGLSSLVVLIAVFAIAAIGCANTGLTEVQDGEKRLNNYEKAASTIKEPNLTNFQSRRALAKYTEELDKNQEWYTYVLGDNGNVIGYFVSSTKPQNSCNFLSSAEKVLDWDEDEFIIQAPSLEGIYYADSVCDAWFFFDATTGATMEIRDVKYFTSNQQLLLDAEPIKVAAPEPGTGSNITE